MPRLQVDAVLFDLDGTLVDVSQSYRKAVRLTAGRALGRDVSTTEVDAVKRLPGFNNDWDATWAVVQVANGRRLTRPDEHVRQSPEYRALLDVFQTYYLGSRVWREVSGGASPFEWDHPLIAQETPLVSPAVLGDLRPLPLGIATSRPRMEARMAIEQHGLDGIIPLDMVVALEDAPAEKPDPAPLLVLAGLLGCKHPVYVGDTVNDALASEAAGMPFILVGNEILPDGVMVHHRIASAGALHEAIELPVGQEG